MIMSDNKLTVIELLYAINNYNKHLNTYMLPFLEIVF